MFSTSRSDLCCHHFTIAHATFRRSSCVKVNIHTPLLTDHAGLTLTYSFWYTRSWASTAQIVRAILLASATTTTFGGRRCPNCSTHEIGRASWRERVCQYV